MNQSHSLTGVAYSWDVVKTGKYRPGDENKPGVVPPDEVHESFAEFVNSLLKRA